MAKFFVFCLFVGVMALALKGGATIMQENNIQMPKVTR